MHTRETSVVEVRVRRGVAPDRARDHGFFGVERQSARRFIQAFIRPHGQLFLFRSTAGPDAAPALTPPLSWLATFPLIESLRSRLVVLEKHAVAGGGRISTLRPA